MALATPELLNAVADLSTVREMKIAVNMSAQCGMIAGFSTMAGALLAGPVGIAIGGTVGTVLATLHGNGKFKSVPEVLAEDATPEQKEKLATALRNLLRAENILTIMELAASVQNNRLLIEGIRKIVREFIMSDMGYCFIS